ncbi:MAG: pectate lyase [Verrucomicrobiota bacterium]
MRFQTSIRSLLLVSLALLPRGVVAEPGLREIASAMKHAAVFYVEKIARHGGYVYYTAPDFSKRSGEGIATENQVWVQPPGTPSVGLACLKAYRVTEDPYYLEAALAAADALIYGQLKSGAWTNLIDFDPKSPRAGMYRNGQGKGRNFSTLDDDISQAAIQFLVQLDHATAFKNANVHDSVAIALDALLAAQFPNGAFPQGWDDAPQPSGLASDKRASFPNHDWRTEGRIKEYWHQYTLNDSLAPTVAKTLMVAHQAYKDERYAEALKRFGKFLILAQMPEPQPGWAQQYNYEMEPIWARKFEPAAIAGRESEGVVVTLLQIAAYFRDQQFLAPIPSAIAYLKRSELDGERLARYYELETNKPLYMERKGSVYSLTHDDSRLPSHYGWKNPSHIKTIEAAYQGLLKTGKLVDVDQILPPLEPDPSVAEIVADLDDEGRWISIFDGELLVGQPKFQPGEAYIDSAVFCRNLEILAAALAR